MSKNSKMTWNRMVLDVYCDKPIAFIPVLARIGGGATAGLYLSQMLYWGGKGYDKEWIYKTIDDMEEETCLCRSEQERAFEVWSKLGVIEKEVRGVPPKRHFRLNLERVFELLDIANHYVVDDKINCLNEQNTITESTSENTKHITDDLKDT